MLCNIVRIYKKFDQDISVVPTITDFVIQHRSLVASNSSTFTSLLDLLYTYQASSDLCCSVLESLPNCVPSEWVSASDKLITDQLFFSSPPYSVEELIEQIVQKSPDCLQNTLSTDTTKSYTNLASHMLERVCRQHVVKSLQPCLKNELEFLKEVYYFAINELIEKENSLHDKLDELRKEKREAYQAFDWLKSKHDSKITTIDSEKSDTIAQLDRIDKEEKEELSKTKKKEEELTKELGDKSKEKPKQPETAQDNTSKAKETEKQQLQSRLQSLNQQRSDLQVSFKEAEIAYEKEQAKLEKEEEDITDSLHSLKVTKQVYQEKIDKLSKVSINNFDDYESYNELLECLYTKINDTNLTVSSSFPADSLVNLRDKKISKWTREDLGIWASSLPKVIKSASSFSRHIVTIIAAIKRAIALSQGSSCDRYQLLQLLSVLFPFKENAWISTPVEDPLVVAMLASISALYMGQISLVTDDKRLPISKSQVKGYLPFFDLLKLQAIKRSSLSRMPTTSGSKIVYGSQSDFKENRSKLIDYEQLKKRQKALNISYSSASSIFTQDLNSQFSKKPISSWSVEELEQWSSYVQKESFPSKSIPPIEYIAVVKHAVNLAYGSTPSIGQLWALFAKLDNGLDQGGLTQQEQQDPLVLIMASAVEALQKKSPLLTASLPNISISDLKNQETFFSLLNLGNSRSDSTITPSNGNLLILPEASPSISIPLLTPVCSDISKSSIASSPLDIQLTACAPSELLAGSRTDVAVIDPTEEKSTASLVTSIVPISTTSISPMDPQEDNISTNGPSGETASINKEVIIPSISSTELADSSIDRATTSAAPSVTESTSYKVLTKAYASIQAAYISPSDILKSSKDPSYNSFKDKPISSWTGEELSSWAKYLSDVYSPKRPKKSELIAVVKRAVELSHGFSPRDSQLLTLITLLPNSSKGRLAQVNTGEGKSLIVAMLAAIHALKGKNVDVVTTSTELSIPEVKKQKPFFSLLNLTVSENSKTSNKKAAYKSNIVYGTSADFQSDILHKEVSGDDIRGLRDHDIVLVDEVDSMLFDNRTHSVRLSSGNPGMNHLLLPLGTIWNYIQNITRHMFEYDGSTYFIVEDYIREGTHIELLSSPGENWQNYATKVDDDQSFITEKTSEHLGKLLRNLTSEEKYIYQSYIDQQYKLTLLESDKQALEEKIEKAKVPFDMPIWNKKSICEKLNRLESEKEVKEEEIKQVQVAIDSHPWKKEHYPIIDIPEHLHDFAKQQIPYWIKNALHALCSYSKNKHYKVINKKIVPVQFKETGVLQSGLVWSDGLTQFLQMKEGLPIDPEGVATNFISNVGFFRRYGNAIYGLTGTLGDASTQDFLSELYGTDFVTIPPHKRITIKDNHHSPYLCKELAPIIVEKANWQPTIIQQSLYHAHQKRAVLVICESIKDANHLAEQLKKYYPSEKVFSYTGEDNFRKKEEEEVSSGEIIVATNIAGRGTDLKTSQQVEDHGGLYVAVTFLPESYRVELQNVGRTARAGKKGMAQLILCQNSTITMAELKSERDRKEINAIEHAKEDAKRMLLQDALFQNFCELEKKYLPSAYDCENLRLAEKIIPQWEAYLSSRFTESKLKEEFQKWASKKKDTFQKKIVDESLSTRDQESLQSGFEGKVSSQYNDYKQQYKNQLLEKFRKRNPTISDELATCLSSGKAFTIEMPELAKIHKWGKAERKALEERWALWLKGKHIDHGPLSKALPLLEDFDQEFSSKIEQDAQQDNLITNPYFHVLKGNDWIEKQEYDQAIISFDRAIDLDPIFSVHAHYNKARALLSCDDNAGKPQEIAYSELKKAKTIISTIYRPNLLSFHKLVARFKAKTHTARDIQKLLDLVNQQENYIERACKIIEEAQKDEKGKWKDHNVKLTNKLVKSTFQPLEAGDYDKAIKEANINGLTNLFTVKEVIPISWASIVSVAIIGLAQVTAGVLMLCTTGTGLGLIKEGISDLITTVKSAIHGSFSWAAWATQKAISMAVSLLSAGWSSLKASCLSVKDAAKDLVLSSTKVAVQEEATKSVTKVLATEITKGITGELLHTAGKWVANKVLLEGIEDKIRSKVETALNEAFQSNEIVQKGLGEDIKNENKNWQKRFVAVGHRILAEKASLHPCLSMVKEIAKGVACNKVEYLDESLKAAGVLKMLAELNTFTQNFIEDFNNEVNNYKEEVNQSNEQISNQTIENDTSDLTIMASAPYMDMEEGIIPIDKVADGTSYCSKEIGEENTLETNFENLGPSTNENLVSHFKSHISNKLINILHEGADPVTSYATSKLNNQFFKKIDAVNAEALNTIKVNRLLTRIGSEAAQQKNQTETAGKDKPKDDKETEPESSEQDTGKETDNSNKKQTQLSTKAKAYQKEFAKDGPKDRTAFATLAAVLGVPIHIYNSKGERTHVIENGKGPAIQLVFEPGNDNKPGHYGILSNDNIKNPDYHIDPNKQNCWLDAVMMQIPPEKFTQLGGTDGILKKGMDHMNANPDVYNQLCETRNQVRQIDGTKLLEGGETEIFSFPYLKALWEGNTKRAQEIADLHHNWELLAFKTLINFYSKLPILDTVTLLPYLLYNTKGALDNFIGIVDETSSRLNDDFNTDFRRIFIEGKRGQVFEDIKYKLPIFGNYKRFNQERKKGNYLKSFGYGTLGTVEAIAIASGILGGLKGVRTVSKQLKGTTNVKPSGIESTATASAKNLTKQGGTGAKGGNSIGNTTTTSLVPCKIAKAAQKIANGEYSITKTVAQKLDSRPYINSPSTIKNIITSSKGIPDKTFQGGMNWKVSGEFNGRKGVYELGMNPETGVIYHFLFKRVK